MDRKRLWREGEVVRAEQRATVARELAERFPTVPHAQEQLRRAEKDLEDAQWDLDRLKLRTPK